MLKGFVEYGVWSVLPWAQTQTRTKIQERWAKMWSSDIQSPGSSI